MLRRDCPRAGMAIDQAAQQKKVLDREVEDAYTIIPVNSSSNSRTADVFGDVLGKRIEQMVVCPDNERGRWREAHASACHLQPWKFGQCSPCAVPHTDLGASRSDFSASATAWAACRGSSCLGLNRIAASEQRGNIDALGAVAVNDLTAQHLMLGHQYDLPVLALVVLIETDALGTDPRDDLGSAGAALAAHLGFVAPARPRLSTPSRSPAWCAHGTC